MKIAVVQMNAGADKSVNLRRAEALTRRALGAGARFVVLPEVFNFRGPLTRERLSRDVAEPVNGPSSAPFRILARRKRAYILLGSLYERIPRSRKVYNTSVLIGPDGRVAASYRKRHLFDARIGTKSIRESNVFRAGRKLVTASIGKFRVGLSICYDLRFPEHYSALARRGCDILTVPSSFTKKTGSAHWETLLRARAIENLAYVAAPNQIGKDGKGVPTYGNSMIIDPWGRILARGSGAREEILYAVMDRRVIDEALRILPSIRGPRS